MANDVPPVSNHNCCRPAWHKALIHNDCKGRFWQNKIMVRVFCSARGLSSLCPLASLLLCDGSPGQAHVLPRSAWDAAGSLFLRQRLACAVKRPTTFENAPVVSIVAFLAIHCRTNSGATPQIHATTPLSFLSAAKSRISPTESFPTASGRQCSPTSSGTLIPRVDRYAWSVVDDAGDSAAEICRSAPSMV